MFLVKTFPKGRADSQFSHSWLPIIYMLGISDATHPRQALKTGQIRETCAMIVMGRNEFERVSVVVYV